MQLEIEKGNVTLWVPEIEGDTIGVSLTRRDGLTMQRVCIELSHEAAEKLRDHLSIILAKGRP